MAFQKGQAPPEYNPQLPVIYTGWSGYRVQEFTYSMAVDIDKCGFYTRSTRIEGLQPILESAGFKFGDCIETAIREHYERGIDPVDVFNVEWGKWKDVNLMYREREEDWNNLLQVGRGLLRQFPKVRETLFPFTNLKFSLHPVKQNWYRGSGLGYILDGVAHEPGEDVLIDFKTSGNKYDDNQDHQGWPMLDPQLRVGALVTGIRKVAFLTAVKTKNPYWQFIEGRVTDELLRDTDLWLREMYDRYVEQKFYRRAGMRFPSEHCKMCDVLPKCLGRDDLVKLTLRQKTKRETDAAVAVLDEMD